MLFVLLRTPTVNLQTLQACQRPVQRPHCACRFLLCMAFIPAGVALCSIPFLNHVPFVQQSEVSGHPQVCTTGRTPFRTHVLCSITPEHTLTAVLCCAYTPDSCLYLSHSCNTPFKCVYTASRAVHYADQATIIVPHSNCASLLHNVCDNQSIHSPVIAHSQENSTVI